MKRVLAFAVVTCLFGGLATLSQATLVVGDVINIDLQSPDSTAVAAVGNVGPYSQTGTPAWNVFAGWGSDGTPMALVDAGGEDDGLTFSVTANGGWQSPNYLPPPAPDTAAIDYFQENVADVLPFSITNVPAGSYELYVIAGISQWSEGSPTVVSVAGEEDQTITWTGGSDLPSGTGWASGVNYVKFDVTLSSPGTIAGSISKPTDTAFLNGLQLNVVPDPNSTRLQTLTPTPDGSFSISWDTTIGRSYDVQYTENMIDWNPLATGYPEGGATEILTTYVDPAPGGEIHQRIYRTAYVPPVDLFFDDMESGEGGWTHGGNGSGTEWELGAPSNVGPPAAYSGTNCWATNLEGTYETDTVAWLRSPTIDLTGVSAAGLSFQHFLDIDDDFHRGEVNVLDPAGNLVVDDLIMIDVSANTDWSTRSVTLPPEALNREIVVEFQLVTDSIGNRNGWYIDDVTVTPQ